jgi:hypothetical protein
MPGYPLDGTYLGHPDAWFPIIYHWLGHGELFPPGVGPPLLTTWCG